MILTILRPCTTGGIIGTGWGGIRWGGEGGRPGDTGVRGQRSEDEAAEKNGATQVEDRGAGMVGVGNSVGLFLQIVLLQTLAG